MKATDKLKKIEEILNSYESLIQEALNDDSEVTLNGCGVNCCEAAHTFRAIAKDIREVL